MVRLLSLLALTYLGCSACADQKKPWVGTWGANQVTLSLLPNGTFESKRTPVASTKPSVDVYLKGTWTVEGKELSLTALTRAGVYGPVPKFTWGSIEPVHFTAKLPLKQNPPSIVYKRSDSLQDAFGYWEFTLKKTNRSPKPLVDWDALAKRSEYLKTAVAPKAFHVLPKGTSPKGKIYFPKAP